MLDPLPLELSNLPIAWTTPHRAPGSDVYSNRSSVWKPESPTEVKPLSLSLLDSRSSSGSPDPSAYDPLDATVHSRRFPTRHRLNKRFARSYVLREEIGSGGYGFVMVASRRGGPGDVAVKFIIKKKVPAHAWVQDSKEGLLPTEIWLLSRVRHPNIADFLEYFEDDVYYYLVRSMIPKHLWWCSITVERSKSFMVLLGSQNALSKRADIPRREIIACLVSLARSRPLLQPILCFSRQ